MKNKKFTAILVMMIIAAMIFASCSAQGTNEVAENPSTEQASDALTPADAQVGEEEKIFNETKSQFVEGENYQ